MESAHEAGGEAASQRRQRPSVRWCDECQKGRTCLRRSGCCWKSSWLPVPAPGSRSCCCLRAVTKVGDVRYFRWAPRPSKVCCLVPVSRRVPDPSVMGASWSRSSSMSPDASACWVMSAPIRMTCCCWRRHGSGDGLVQVVHEGERGAAHVQGFVRAVGHHEGWGRVGGVVPLVEPKVEGAPTEDDGADGGKAFGDELTVSGRRVTDPLGAGVTRSPPSEHPW